jgi:hypothetical protein
VPTSRQTVVAPLGLILLPNPYGQYPAGALAQAQNVVCRAPGELWQAPSFGNFTTFGANGNLVQKMFPIDAGHIYTWDRDTGTLTWRVRDPFISNTAVAIPSIASVFGLFFDTGQIWPIRARERMLVNTRTCGVFVGDNMAPPTTADAALRSAGMPQPHMRFNGAGLGSVIPGNTTVGYAAVLKRTFADGYEVVSVPSPVAVFSAISSTQDPGFTVLWSSTAGVVAGDLIEVYRTDGTPNQGSQTVDPGDTLKLILTRTLTSGDISASLYTFTDTQVMQAPFFQTTGRELYTNPGQETALQANRQPNIVEAMAKFQNYVFFGAVTERPAWTWAVPAGMGSSQSASVPAVYRASGLGNRAGLGTITSGSNTITGISAADIVGVKVGQSWSGALTSFASGTTVTAVGTTTITMSANALGNAAAFSLQDRIILDGVPIDLFNYNSLLQPTMSNYEVTTDQAVNVATLATGVVLGTTITIEPVRPAQSTITVTATNGANYMPPVPEFGSTAQTFSRKRTPNLLQWSKDSQPESVPPSNEINIGQGTIISMFATKNALWIFCTDGLFRLSGDAPPWRVDIVDPSLILVAPQAAVQMRDTIYAYCNYGVVAISDSGIVELTQPILNEQFPGPPYSATPTIILERNELDDEVIVWLGGAPIYIYNINQKAWTTFTGVINITSTTALAFQRSPATGPAGVLFGISGPAFGSSYSLWNPSGTTYLPAIVRYQPNFGDDDPLIMKQYVDETLLFQTSDAAKTVTVTEAGTSIASVALTTHNNDSYGTVGVPRTVAITQTSSPGFTMTSSSTQFRFRGISQRFVFMTDQAWRK